MIMPLSPFGVEPSPGGLRDGLGRSGLFDTTAAAPVLCGRLARIAVC